MADGAADDGADLPWRGGSKEGRHRFADEEGQRAPRARIVLSATSADMAASEGTSSCLVVGPAGHRNTGGANMAAAAMTPSTAAIASSSALRDFCFGAAFCNSDDARRTSGRALRYKMANTASLTAINGISRLLHAAPIADTQCDCDEHFADDAAHHSRDLTSEQTRERV
jgi:hypothetical protein